MSAYEDVPVTLAPGRVLHFNEQAWDALQESLAARNLTLMAEHVAEQRKKNVIVLDPEDFGSAGFMVDALRSCPTANSVSRALADQIEAQVKPPRMAEPGLWGVVEATGATLPRRRWVHHEEGRWVCDTGVWRYWDDLIDPQPIRDGIEDGAL